MKDKIYIYPYGSKWAWKFETGVAQKLYPDLETALHYVEQVAEKYNSEIFIEVKGKFQKYNRLRRKAK